MVHYVQGCSEGVDPFLRVLHPWSAAHSDDYGYTRMTVHNTTHLYMEQVSDDQVCSVCRLWHIDQWLLPHVYLFFRVQILFMKYVTSRTLQA